MDNIKHHINYNKNKALPVSYALIAAFLYGVSSPISKILLNEIPPAMLAALLYLGAGMGMAVIYYFRRIGGKGRKEAGIAKSECPYILGMVVLDIAASVLLMVGLSVTTSSNASLLNNFEIAATALIAYFVFRESIGKRMFLSVLLIFLASIVLSFEGGGSFVFSKGSVLILAGCACWGLENNFTRMVSLKDPVQIVMIKGIGSGSGSFLLALLMHQSAMRFDYVVYALALGFAAFGFSILLYIRAQRDLGAARTSAYYAAAPFIGVAASWIFLHEQVSFRFLAALLIMLLGTYFAVSEKHRHSHIHSEIVHSHQHRHNDGHHNHVHNPEFVGVHTHEHRHGQLEHCHEHYPDLHHRHSHK